MLSQIHDMSSPGQCEIRPVTGMIQAHLTLNMLNCFKNYERYIHILNHILDLA